MIEKIKQYLQLKAWFLFLLPFLFIINGYNDFFGFFPLKFVLINLLVTILTVTVIYLLFAKFFRDNNKNCIFTFYLSVFLLGFGFLHDTCKNLFGKIFITSYTFLLPLILLVFYLLTRIIRKDRRPTAKLFLYLNTLIFCLFIYELVKFSINFLQYRQGSTYIDSRFEVSRNFNTNVSLPDSSKPDIFFLVFDAMASSKALKKAWSFDNTTLDTMLNRQGFYIPTNARSNYHLTILSVSSTFNMDYIPEEKLFSGSKVKMYFRSANSIMNNSLTQILTKQGYRIFHYQPVSFINSDWKYKPYFSTLLTMNFFYRTLPGRLKRDILWNIFRIKLPFIQEYCQQHFKDRDHEIKDQIEGTVADIKKACEFNSMPKMVYGHFMLPHHPYIFTADGELVNQTYPVITTKETDIAGYKKQVIYANKLILELATYIKQYNKKNTIIIIKGDHGYKYFEGQQLPLIYRNFYAMYSSGIKNTMIYDSISSVNTFRIILNQHFKADLPLLPNKSYYIETVKDKVTGIKEVNITE